MLGSPTSTTASSLSLNTSKLGGRKKSLIPNLSVEYGVWGREVSRWLLMPASASIVIIFVWDIILLCDNLGWPQTQDLSASASWGGCKWSHYHPMLLGSLYKTLSKVSALTSCLFVSFLSVLQGLGNRARSFVGILGKTQYPQPCFWFLIYMG